VTILSGDRWRLEDGRLVEFVVEAKATSFAVLREFIDHPPVQFFRIIPE
jgi:hypothetical protein